jgi:hypothetical protein
MKTQPCENCKDPVPVLPWRGYRRLVFCKKPECIRVGLELVPSLFKLKPK